MNGMYVISSEKQLRRLLEATWSHGDVMYMFVDENILWHINAKGRKTSTNDLW